MMRSSLSVCCRTSLALKNAESLELVEPMRIDVLLLFCLKLSEVQGKQARPASAVSSLHLRL